MLTNLRLINFRRHIDTSLDFSDDAQIIAITGKNGAGKSSILEAITFALYGESRHGRRNLARMVRRGGEHEGMQVELGFNVGDVHYDLVRRMEKGKASARLFANGTAAMQSPDGVTAEVTKILGMDSAGFRMAVIAQQFDVDGLADLTPAKRKQTVTRLLRQDALTRARLQASDEKNRQLEVLRILGSAPEMDELEAEAAEARAELENAQEAEKESSAAIERINAALGQSSKVQERWQAAQMEVARTQALVAAAQAEVDRVGAELRDLHVPDAPVAGGRKLEEILAELTQVGAKTAKAEAAAQVAATVAATQSELDDVRKQLVDVKDKLSGDSPAKIAMSLSSLQAKVNEAQAALTAASATYDATREAWFAPNSELSTLKERQKSKSDLGEVCDRCEQPIPESHVHALAQARTDRIKELETVLATVKAEGAAAAAARDEAEAALTAARKAVEAANARKTQVDALLSQRASLQQRESTYTARLSRLVVEEVEDVEELYARKGLLELERAAAEQASVVEQQRTLALARQEHLTATLAGSNARLEAARLERAAAEPDSELVAQYAQRAELIAGRDAEQEMLAAVQAEVVRAQAGVLAAERAIEQAEAAHAKVAGIRGAADRAAKAARLLEVTAERLATQIRPALEGEISNLLLQLSEGRFTAVQVSDSYEISVFDDGKYEPLSDLSGGERVLVALATRLALANVVTGRHAAGGAGFLILDECFGSQDADRRDAILAGLRALRATYGQILLISHVGGLEEAADRVLDVSIRTEDGDRVAQVLAA